LASCYRTALLLARKHELESVAFPAISCGVYGYPIQEAALVAVTTVRQVLSGNQFPRRVLLVGYDPAVVAALRSAAK
jgi:O-acetyl-ADP-ribose deacetylase (regulator of RNase III)